MYIDIERAKKKFIEFTKQFDLEDSNIKRKQLHSLRVMAISEEIAKKLKLNQEEIEIATLIGLLHDIGRFMQYSSIGLGDMISGFDHGDYGVEVLNKNIREFIKTDKYDEIIKTAIKNHNKYKIEDGIDERKLLFAKIIRDADKIDILYEYKDIFYLNEEEKVNESVLSEYVYQQCKNQKLIKKETDKKYYGIDGIMIGLGYTYDINFKESYKIIKKANYINDTINRFCFKDKKTKERVEELTKILNNYIEQHI